MSEETSRVFISRLNTEPYMEISSDQGFINPITASFAMRDSKETLINYESFYIVAVNSNLSWVKLKSIGELNGTTVQFSWTGFSEDFSNTIEQEVNVDATGSTYSIPFHVKFEVNDDMGILPLDQYLNTLQIRFVYL